jgi:transposase
MRLDHAGQDSGSALEASDLDHLLALQQRILEYLSPQAQARDGGAGPAGSYFSDLIATTHLIKLTWPLGAEFLPSARLEGLVQAYVEPLLVQITAQYQNKNQKAASNRKSKIAPSDSALCGALLAAADVALGNRELITLRPRMQPLAREAYRRARSYAGGICRSTEISPALARATTWHFHRMSVRDELRALSTQYDFRVEEIPSFLPLTWFGQYFGELVERLPRYTTTIERHLRRGASLRLAELKSGATWGDCAPVVGMQSSLARSTLKHLGRQLDALCLWPAFNEAVEQVAEYLDTASQRIDYANRRRHLASWHLPLDDWLAMSDGLPGLERLREKAIPMMGSALIWADVTEGERMHSPVVLDLRETGEDTRALCALLYRMGNGARGPSLRLRRRLHLYAERLAASCDKNHDLAVSVCEVIRKEGAVAAGVIQEEGSQANFDATSRVATLNRTVCEMADPVRQMAPDHLWDLFQRAVPSASDQACKAASRRIGNREALAAIVFASTSGCAWLLLPSGFGISGGTALLRFIEWSEAQVWTELHQLLRDATGSQGDLDWSRHAIDAVSARAGERGHGRR